MLEMIQRKVAEVAGGRSPAPDALRLALQRAEHTQPASNIEKLPLDHVEARAIRANSHVVIAEAAIMREEEEFKSQKDAHKERMTELKAAHEQALDERRLAQHALLKRLKDHGAFEGISDFNTAVRDA